MRACRSSKQQHFAFPSRRNAMRFRTNILKRPAMNLARFLLLASTALCMANANAASDIVLIDRTEKAYTVYAGLPMEQADELKGKLEGKPVDIVTFQQFNESLKKFIGELT